ncbi:YidC/Oxa1 family membrane protein insertase [Candidatus Gracilibacteria bacterium]|nr:YidC/Oxa1 family membrane protein insertase [Candidatus Gracilibacteria bacterium]
MNKFKDFLKSFLIWFLVFYAILAGYEYFWGKKNQPTPQGKEEVLIQPVKNSVVIGNLVQWKITNHLADEIVFSSPCETPGTMVVSRVVNDQNLDISSPVLQDCAPESILSFRLQPESSTYFSLNDFNHELFMEAGKYGLEMKFSEGENIVTTTAPEVELQTAGSFRRLFRTIVSKPLFNLLVFLADTLPGHPLGWSIVIMTLLVRLALFIPNQKAMRSQREMQKLQPKMEEIKKQHGKNQQMVAMKTMELYKTHKISPFSSCLPMLLQMPFLIGVYYIVRDGLSPSLSYLLYSFQQSVDLSLVNNDFYGLDLSIKGPIYLAVLVGLTQWGAVKLSLISAKKKQAKHEGDKPIVPNQMQQMNTIMLWVMPVMIGFFTTSFPAGVGIYWLTSTLFGIAQQKYVNWQLDQPQVTRKEV